MQQLGIFLAHLTPPYQPSPIPLSGRPAHRPFRGLLSVHSRCGLHTRAVTVFRDRYPKASDISSPPCLLRLLPAGANRRVGLAPTEKRRLVTAHVGRCHSFPAVGWPRCATSRRVMAHVADPPVAKADGMVTVWSSVISVSQLRRPREISPSATPNSSSS